MSVAGKEFMVWELGSGVCTTSVTWCEAFPVIWGPGQMCVSRQMGGAWCITTVLGLSCMWPPWPSSMREGGLASSGWEAGL